jgi:serine/threonine protein kinase
MTSRRGMGIVYPAWDLLLRGTFAVKVLRTELASAEPLIARMKKEAAIAMSLTHENIVRVHHFEPSGTAFGPFLVMEHISWDSGDKWSADAGARGLPVDAVLTSQGLRP